MRAGLSTEKWGLFEFRFDVDWMKRYHIRGVVIGRKVMFSEPADSVPVWIFRHELEHAYQIIREGKFMFYLKFFLFSLRYGYRRNPYEIEARDKQHLPLTEAEEQLLWKLRGN